MKIQSTRFGTIEVREDRILRLKGGILGFNQNEKYALVDDQEDPNHPFRWLISIDDPEIGFLVTDPGIFFKDYAFDLAEADKAELAIISAEDVIVLTLLTVPKDPKQITANLAGPIVINANTLQGKQLVLYSTTYATKHFIFIQTKTEELNAAANAAVTQNFAIATEAVAAEVARAVNHTEVKTTL